MQMTFYESVEAVNNAISISNKLWHFEAWKRILEVLVAADGGPLHYEELKRYQIEVGARIEELTEAADASVL